jgi:hypothetical protein
MTFLQFLKAVGFKATAAQRVMCTVAFDDVDPCDLEGEDRELARSLFGAMEKAPMEARDVVAITKGARIGGTLLSAHFVLWRAMFAPLPSLAPGELAAGIVVAPDMRLANQALRYARGAANELPKMRKAIETDGSHSFTFRRPDGRRVAIEALPATRGGSALRGRSVVAAHFSEAAFFRDAGAIINDLDLYRAVVPRLVPGAKLVVESTPWVESGLLFELHRDNFGDPKTAIAAHAPTLLMRPDARMRALVEKERVRDPANAATEFDAEFLGKGAGQFFDSDAIRLCVVENRPLVTKAPPGAMTFVGADIGLTADASAFVAISILGDRIEVLEVLEMKPKKGEPLKLSEVVETGAALCKMHGATSFIADAYVREPAREFAEKHGIRIDAAPGGNEAKVASYIQLRKVLNEGRITMSKHPTLVQQLHSIVGKPTSGGGMSIQAPRRAGVAGHGDIVSALVLAVAAAGNRTPIPRPTWRLTPGAYRLGNGRGF